MPDSAGTPPYENDSLRWVAAEVRFPLLDEFGADPLPNAIRDRLQETFPVHEELNELSVGLGPAGPSAQQVRRHRFVTRERLMSTTIGREAILLETTAYTGWTSFRTTFLDVLRAISDVRRPDGLLRLGLRYVDEIRIPQPVATFVEWSGWVDDRLVAPFTLDAEAIPDAATTTLQYGQAPGHVVVFRAAPLTEGRTVQAEGPLRMPFETPAGPYFLLDTDASWMDPGRQVPEFDPDQVELILNELHEPCNRLFEASVTDRLRDEVLRRPREEVWAQSGA